MNRSRIVQALIALAILYSIVHFAASGVVFAVQSPNVGQIIEELQPLYRLYTTGAATVDHPRQYGPVFVMLFHPVYRLDMVDRTMVGWYAYALDLLAILVGFVATFDAIRSWAASKNVRVGATMVIALGVLWANFSPLYGVLAIKNVEIWELALIAVAAAALLRGNWWAAGWAIGAAALIKMLPLVFLPYLLLRHRRAFAHALIAMAVITTISQGLYGTALGWGYLPTLVSAAVGGDGYGNAMGLMWHENISLRGVIMKAFGYLEPPAPLMLHPDYPRGYYVRFLPEWMAMARGVSLLAEAAGAMWVAWMLWRRRPAAEPSRTFWDWALVGIMLLVLAPQISQDYMVLTLVAFSFVLAGCMLYGSRALWIQFAVAVLLVGNVVPRGVFSRLMLIDPIIAATGYQHLTRAEAYQYFGFPLLGLLVLARAWYRVSALDDRGAVPRARYTL
jgi:hypothetical protein